MLFLNHQFFFSFLAEIVYVDGCIVGLTWGCAICSRCCVIQTRIRLQTPKLPACSARTSVSTTAKCGGLWSRAGRRTDALHCAACHCFLVPFSYQNACICVTKIAEFNCDCCSPVWALPCFSLSLLGRWRLCRHDFYPMLDLGYKPN